MPSSKAPVAIYPNLHGRVLNALGYSIKPKPSFVKGKQHSINSYSTLIMGSFVCENVECKRCRPCFVLERQSYRVHCCFTTHWLCSDSGYQNPAMGLGRISWAANAEISWKSNDSLDRLQAWRELKNITSSTPSPDLIGFDLTS